jgi:hypothetical protein
VVFFEDEKIIWSWRCLKLSTHEGTVREKIVPLGDAQEKGVKGGYFEWLTQNPYETGAVDELAGGIILAYRLAQEGVSLEDLNAQFLAEQLSKGYAMTAAKFANAVGALVERKLFFTPGKIPGGQQQGEMGNMEDSQTSVKLPKTVKGMKITGTRGEGALKTVTDHVLGEAPSLQTAQTMFRM